MTYREMYEGPGIVAGAFTLTTSVGAMAVAMTICLYQDAVPRETD